MAKAKKTATKKRKDNKLAVIIAVIAIALIAVIGASYAWFIQTLDGEKSQSITAGKLQVELTEKSAGDITIQKAFPVTKSYAETNFDPFIFSVQNTGSVDALVDIILSDTTTGSSKIPTNKIRYSLKSSDTENGEYTEVSNGLVSELVSAGGKIISQTLTNEGYPQGKAATATAAGTEKFYKLWVYIDETAKETEVTEGMTFTAKLKLNAVQADGGHAYESGTAGVNANPRP